MAGRGAPTFIKRQKEQQRVARAVAKRAAKQARRDRRASGDNDEALDEEVSPPIEQDAGPEGTPAS